ncbi:MAG: DNA polymerase III subunit gamma/tau [Woeseiaceae bacterium]
MSYLVLARKWRPQTFADVVGQQHVLKALSHSLDNERLHHAYLFAGTRGVGKTTLARILAKALNCERGISATPCGECSACHEIDEGRFVDLIEVDAASRTKVDDTRELLDNVQYAPTRGRFKVYLIDEVHMLSTHSFNALLKTLEEPPEHVKFLLATTDPQKLPVTVLSRCLQFNLKRMTPGLIQDRLAHIAQEEGFSAEAGALQLMARAADGSLRDALSLMDQAVAFGGGSLPEAAVAEMLGALDRGHVVGVLNQLAADDPQALLSVIAEADEQFPDYRRLLDELAGLLSRIAIFQATGASDLDEVELADVERLAGLIAPEDTQLWYQIALIGKRDLPLAPDPRIGVEMTLLRMLAFRPPAPGSGQSSGNDQSARPRKLTPVGKTKSAVETPSTAKSAAKPTVEVGAPPTAASGLEDWNRLVGQLKLSGVVRLLAANCAYVSRDGQCVHLALDKRNSSMLADNRIKELAGALSTYLGDDVTVEVAVSGEAQLNSPVRSAERAKEKKTIDTREAVAQDPGVAEMQKLFDAKVEDIIPLSDVSGETQ